MKKLMILFVVVFTAVGVTACTPREEAPPVVEIVERTSLLDGVDLNAILPQSQRESLAKQGITVGFDGTELTGDNSVRFDLLITKDGKNCTLPLTAFIDYDKTIKGDREIFENIRLYWGQLLYSGDKLVLSQTDKLTFVDFSADVPTVTDITAHTMTGEGGTIVKTILNGTAYTSLVSGADEAYLYLARGTAGATDVNISKTMLKSNTFIDTDSRGVMPFDIDKALRLSVMGNNTFVITDNYLYMETEGEGAFRITEPKLSFAQTENTTYSLFKIGKYNSRGHRLVAVKTENGADSVVLLDSTLTGNTTHRLEITDTATVKCAATGLELDVDFANGKAGRLRQKISAEDLGERLFVSQDKKYELYKFATETVNGVETYSLALVEKATGKIANLGCVGVIAGAMPGEAGFLPNGNIYILNSEDLYVYTNDVDSPTPAFTLSAHQNIDASHYLVAATYNEKTRRMAVVYYDESGQYGVHLLDRFGRLDGYFIPNLDVKEGNCPVTIYPKGENYILTITDGATGETLHKETLNIRGDKYFNNIYG